MEIEAPAQASGKLRLMCSYGGQILPRPRINSFCYVGGDTRIVSMERRAVTTLSSLVSHLSTALSLNSPFSVKYQLPHLDLDSLISLASDDDFHILLDEHSRLSSSRIRLFLFPLKTDSWFFDALHSASILHNADPSSSSSSSSSSAADSLLLDTTSSFGSTSSSASFSNFPPIRPQPHADDNDNDALFKFASSDTIPSDSSVSSIMSTQQNVSYQYHDPVVRVSEARLSAESIEAESKMPHISFGVTANNTNMDTGRSPFPQFNQVERPHLQFVQAATQFLPLHPSGLLPVPSCQLVYQPPPPLQHLAYHPSRQSCPVYLVPIGDMPPNPNCLPLSATGQASLNLNASSVNCHAAQNAEVGAGFPSAHGFGSQNYLTNNATSSFVYVPYNGSQQREMDIYPMHQQPQNVSVTSKESPKYGRGNELDDDLAHVQIYKSQPPPPTVSSKYQTMTKDTANLLSEALAQLHVDNLKQQTETSQPL